MKLREEIEKILGDFVMDKIGLADGCWLDVTDVVVDKARSWALECVGEDDKRNTKTSSLNFNDAANRIRNELRKEQRKKIEEVGK